MRVVPGDGRIELHSEHAVLRAERLRGMGLPAMHDGDLAGRKLALHARLRIEPDAAGDDEQQLEAAWM